MYCMKCGEEIPDDSKVCGYCGFKLPVQVAAPEAPKPVKKEKTAAKPAAEKPKAEPAREVPVRHVKPRRASGWKLPVWGWIAIGVGVVVLVMLFSLGGSSNVVELFRDCEESYRVPAGETLELHYGYWGVTGDEWIEANRAALRIYLYVNDTPGVGRQANPVRTRDLPCGDQENFRDDVWEDARWLHAVSTLTLGPGTHHIEVVVSLEDQVSDGFDFDGDGNIDFYGPGELSRDEFTLIAEE